jgi:hypothetical protein
MGTEITNTGNLGEKTGFFYRKFAYFSYDVL